MSLCLVAIIASVVFALLMGWIIYLLCTRDKASRKANSDSISPRKKGEPVEIVGETQLNELLDSGEAIMCMFWAPWCGHCKSTKPKYMEAVRILGDGATCALVNGDVPENAPLIKKYGIRGYPSILMLKKNEDHATYRGNRSSESIVDFHKSNN